MNEPRNWTFAELTSDAAEAKELFRRQRLDEPLELYSRFFEIFAPVFGAIIDRLPSLADDSLDPGDIAELVGDRDVRTAFRYQAAPPVSEDDLKTLAETTLSATALRGDVGQARRVRETKAGTAITDPRLLTGYRCLSLLLFLDHRNVDRQGNTYRPVPVNVTPPIITLSRTILARAPFHS